MVFARVGTGSRLLFLLAGPFATGAVGAALLSWGVHLESPVLAVLGIGGLGDAICNLVPHESKGHRSDGARVLDVLRGRVTTSDLPDEMADTLSRWTVLASDPKRLLDGERRARLLGGAPVGLGYRPDDRSEHAMALWRLALAGWCWREAERGDFAQIREAALDALHAATLTGACEPNLTALAARNLLTGPTNLGLASPGDSEHERMSFLHDAFDRLPSGCKHEAIPKAEQRYAFRYGVALRDVERLR